MLIAAQNNVKHKIKHKRIASVGSGDRAEI